MTEIELKFELPAASGARLARSAPLARARPTRRRMTSLYFDTPDCALAEREMALRLRRCAGRWVQTLKGGRSGTGGLHARDEWEFDRPGPSLDLSLLRATPLAQVEGAATLHERLLPAFEVNVVRTAWRLEPVSGCRLEVALDSGTVASGARREEICELEIECLEGDAGGAFDLAARLLDEVAMRPSALTKAQRGYRLFKPRRPRPVKAAALHLEPAMTPLAAARAIIGAGLDQLQANEEGVLRTSDPEFVHQARVALRRMRSALRMFRELIGLERAEAWREELGEVARTLGAARDWDVFATETLPAAAAAYGDTALARTLVAHAARRRRREREAAREALLSPRYSRVILELARWLWRAGGGRAAGERGEALVDFASRLIRKRHKRLLAGALLLGTLSIEERHRVRIDAKRLRYGVDGLASLFKSRLVAPYIDSVAALQDALGQANDAATAIRLLEALAPPPAFAGFARGWCTARAQGDPGVFEPLVAQLTQGRRFWRKKPRGAGAQS